MKPFAMKKEMTMDRLGLCRAFCADGWISTCRNRLSCFPLLLQLRMPSEMTLCGGAGTPHQGSSSVGYIVSGE